MRSRTRSERLDPAAMRNSPAWDVDLDAAKLTAVTATTTGAVKHMAAGDREN